MATSSRVEQLRAGAAALGDAEIRRLSIDTIRGLSMDAVQKANAGHPGTAMALAPLGYTLFKRFLRVNPADTAWPDRDRFVLSAGHACVLQYSLLHLVRLRPRHRGPAAVPPVGLAHARASRARPHAGRRGHDRAARAGLRQRRRHGDGRALPGRPLQPPRARARRPPRLRDLLRRRHDGGHQPGGRLDRRALRPGQADRLLRRQPHHDRRHARRSPSTARATRARMQADGWHVQRVEDSEDLDALEAAIAAARDEAERPSFIAIRSHIAYPAPHAVDTAKAHGAPLGEEEVRATKQVMGFDPERTFWVDERVYEHMSLRERGAAAQAGRGRALRRSGARPSRRWPRTGTWPGRGGCATAGARRCPSSPRASEIATRSAGQKVMAAFAEFAPTMIGGAADLVESTKTLFEGARRVLAACTPGATSRSGSASTRWGRSSTAPARTAGSSSRTARPS